MTWIKICGTTNLDDALMSVDAGADALGFVFYEKSPRSVTPEVVRQIVAKLPEKVEKVGVFVDQDQVIVQNLAKQIGLTAIQLHYTASSEHRLSEESDSTLKTFLSVPASTFDSGKVDRFEAVDALFLDSGSAQQPGGTGKTFDWGKIAPYIQAVEHAKIKIVVAGGLNSGNVGGAIRILNPWGVDVVSGVEASPGKKDPVKVHDFISAVRKFDKSQ